MIPEASSAQGEEHILQDGCLGRVEVDKMLVARVRSAMLAFSAAFHSSLWACTLFKEPNLILSLYTSVKNAKTLSGSSKI